jgi:phosphopantothenoylcysteine decarboxylase/phosphopantothenate--cysteine ligase
MWLHPATQANCNLLRARGVTLIGPDWGDQACGETGPGRMIEPAALADHLLLADVEPTRPLAGRRVLLTAGPTREAIDPVRYVGNRSSGKMGYALAMALAELGARVTVVSGPATSPAPAGIELVSVESALEMEQAVMARIAGCQLFVAAAAVADYRPQTKAGSKLKKDADTMTLRLVRNPDILAAVAALSSPPFTVGFAAETDDLETYATQKLVAKGLDMIAANQVGAADGGFESDDNALLVLWPEGRRELPMMPKPRLAAALAKLIAERYAAST